MPLDFYIRQLDGQCVLLGKCALPTSFAEVSEAYLNADPDVTGKILE